jgi:hypothetical protein
MQEANERRNMLNLLGWIGRPPGMAVEKTCQWEMRHVLPSGEIDMTGSTRMLIERQHNGALKRTNYPEVVQAFVYTAKITGKPEYLDIARRIALSQGWIGKHPLTTIAAPE